MPLELDDDDILSITALEPGICGCLRDDCLECGSPARPVREPSLARATEDASAPAVATSPLWEEPLDVPGPQSVGLSQRLDGARSAESWTEARARELFRALQDLQARLASARRTTSGPDPAASEVVEIPRVRVRPRVVRPAGPGPLGTAPPSPRALQ